MGGFCLGALNEQNIFKQLCINGPAFFLCRMVLEISFLLFFGASRSQKNMNMISKHDMETFDVDMYCVFVFDTGKKIGSCTVALLGSR